MVDGCVHMLPGVVVVGGALTFKIKLLDVFQRLVDKVEASESLRRDTNGRISKTKQPS